MAEKTARSKGNRKPGTNPGGRPTAYMARYAEIGYGLALAGYTDQEMADAFGVAKSTFELWKVKHPKFSDSIRRGKEPANARVAVSLYEMATGYERTEQQVAKDSEGNPEIVDVKVFYPPAPRAAEFFLKNRDRKHWLDVQRVAMTDTDGQGLENKTVEELRAELARVGALDARGRFVLQN